MPRGNCYAASEALYHLLGGKDAGWTPQMMYHGGGTHWFLKHSTGFILDPTADQFSRPPSTEEYARATGKGFLTKLPSKKAYELMQRIMWQ